MCAGEELGCTELIDASKAATRKRGNRLSNEIEGGGRASEEGKTGTYTKVRCCFWCSSELADELELLALLPADPSESPCLR